jgi:hypothetical protein
MRGVVCDEEEQRPVLVSYPVVATPLDQVKPPVAETVPLRDLLHVPQSLTAQKHNFPVLSVQAEMNIQF